jgi:hypothetical protein
MIAAAMLTLYSTMPVEVFTRLFNATVIGAWSPAAKVEPNRKSFQILVN